MYDMRKADDEVRQLKENYSTLRSQPQNNVAHKPPSPYILAI